MMENLIGWKVTKVKKKVINESDNDDEVIDYAYFDGIIPNEDALNTHEDDTIPISYSLTYNMNNTNKVVRKDTEVFNTIFEMELRIILLMGIASNLFFSSVRILSLDFINCYAKNFGIASENLHGNNDFMYGEMAGRRSLVIAAIKKLVRYGILQVENDHGYYYKITAHGLEILNNFHSTYAREYCKVSKLSIKKYSSKSDEELLQEIQHHSIAE